MTSDEVIEMLIKMIREMKDKRDECLKMGSDVQGKWRDKEIRALQSAIAMLEYTCKVHNSLVEEPKEPVTIIISDERKDGSNRPKEIVIKIRI